MFDRYTSRLKYCLCALLFSMFSAVIYTPTTCYLNNIDELEFGFLLFGVWLISFFGITLLCSLLLALTRKKLFQVALSLTFGFGLCAYLQANYLNPVIREFSGAAIDWSIFQPGKNVNLAFWVTVPTLITILSFLSPKVWKNVVLAISCLIFATQAVSLGIVTVMTFANGDPRPEKVTVSAEGRMDYAANAPNIVYLVFDNVDSAVLQEIASEQPELLEALDGFTWYRNYAGMYSRSYPSVQQLLTDVEYQWDMPMPDFNKVAYQNPLLLKALKDDGYFVHYNGNVYGVCAEASRYIDNLTEAKILNGPAAGRSIAKRMVIYSLFMAAPNRLKYHLFKNIDFTSQSLNSAVRYENAGEYYSNYAFYNAVQGDSLTTKAQTPTFHYYHLEGAHSLRYTPDMQLCEEGTGNVHDSTLYCLNVAKAYIDALKAAGLYDNIELFILSDHGNFIDRIGYDLHTADNPILLYKPANSTEGFTVTDVPAWQPDIAATVLSTLGVPYPANGKGLPLPTLTQSLQRSRSFTFSYVWRGEETHNVRYTIGPDANSFEDWKEIDTYYRLPDYW